MATSLPRSAAVRDPLVAEAPQPVAVGVAVDSDPIAAGNGLR